MSDTNKFGGGGAALAEPPVEEAAPQPSTGARPKPMLLVAVVAGVLVLALGAYFLLFSGGGTDTASSGTVPKGTASAGAGAGSTAPSAGAKPVISTVPSTVSGGNARDPFAPLVVPSAASSTAATTAASTGTTVGTTSTGTTVPAGLVEHVTLTSLSSGAVSADVSVNGVAYAAVKPGVLFAKYFTLDPTVVGGTATFHFGDITFQLAAGKSQTVRT
jgi:hypothetical protein